ncbi:MAG: hypothetical protein GF346_06300 [Candidatus Eisenbacteria bacterium]|nr:hypothetical protein [Candidatus Latescibacterota bacterium]MBD3302037.1 hypothetical protein [Candidatus Eisenbacteria bacterium]
MAEAAEKCGPPSLVLTVGDEFQEFLSRPEAVLRLLAGHETRIPDTPTRFGLAWGTLGAVRNEWTSTQARTIALMRAAGPHKEVARRRGVTASTVHKALSGALDAPSIEAEEPLRLLLARLVEKRRQLGMQELGYQPFADSSRIGTLRSIRVAIGTGLLIRAAAGG